MATDWSLRDAALAYQAQGYTVLPLSPGGKAAMVPWAELPANPPSKAQVAAWWRATPDANVGILTGATSGLVVVDVDPAKGGSIDSVLDAAPTLRLVATGNAGYHAYYLYPQDGERVPNSVDLTPGIDIRGDGGLVVAPPSIHANGTRYSWLNEGKASHLPAGVLKRVRAGSRKAKAEASGVQEHWLEDLIANGAEEGSRNNSATRLAGYYAGKQMPRAVVLQMMLDWDETRNNPPLGERDIGIIVQSVFKTESRTKAKEKATPKKGKTDPKGLELTMVPLSEYMRTYGGAQATWQIEGWLPAATIGLVVAPPESFKTWMVLDLAISVASGKPFLGTYKVQEPGTVLLLQLEDHHGSVANRLAAITNAKMGWDLGRDKDPDTFDGLIPTEIPLHIYTKRDFNFKAADLMEQLYAKIKEVRPKLVIIDPLYAAAGVEDFMVGAVADMWRFKAWRDEFGCSFLFAHHTTKTLKGPSERQDGWGSQFLNAYLETGLQVRRVPEMKASVMVRRHFKDAESKAESCVTFDINTERYPNHYKVSVTDDRPDTEVDNSDLLKELEKPMKLKDLAEVLGVDKENLRKRLKALASDCMVEEYRGMWRLPKPGEF